jgi:hypothetical protein
MNCLHKWCGKRTPIAALGMVLVATSLAAPANAAMPEPAGGRPVVLAQAMIPRTGMMVGLGLWNYPIPAFLLELALLFGGMYLYLRTTRAVTDAGRYGMVTFGVAMAIIQSIVFFGPPPVSDKAAAITALALYAIFAGVVYWLEKQRIPPSV